jgi:hypothetical protein
VVNPQPAFSESQDLDEPEISSPLATSPVSGQAIPMKFGRIKRQHGRIAGLDEILNRIVAECPHVSRIVPGRIKVRRGKTPASFRIQYDTPAGLKCLYNSTGTVQEVFLICSDSRKARQWLEEQAMNHGSL